MSKKRTLEVVDLPEGNPTSEWLVKQIRRWCDAQSIDVAGLRTKADLLDRIEGYLKDQSPSFDTILDATDKSIEAAIDKGILDRDLHAGPIAALRVLAKKIDLEDEVRDIALDYASENKLKPPAVDNVSIPTYRNYCESLGLTVVAPKGGAKGGAAGGEANDGPKQKQSKLAGLRGEHAGA